MKKLNTKSITQIAIMTSLFCILGPISFPMKPIPMTLQPLMLSLITLVLPFKVATISIGIYLLLGSIGIPVFAGYASGIHHFFGATGGFLIGFALFPIGYNLIKKIKGNKDTFARQLIGLALSHAILYEIGAFGLLLFSLKINKINIFYGWIQTILLPYYGINIIQSIVAIIIYKALKKSGLINNDKKN